MGVGGTPLGGSCNDLIGGNRLGRVDQDFEHAPSEFAKSPTRLSLPLAQIHLTKNGYEQPVLVPQSLHV